MSVKVQLKGFGNVSRMLRSLPDAVSRKVVLSAQRQALKPTVTDMKLNLASSTTKRTGNLEESLGVKALRKKGDGVASLAGMRTRKRGYHAHLIDAGTKNRRLKRPRVLSFKGNNGSVVVRPVLNTGRVKPTRFITKAINKNSDAVMGNFRESIVRSIDKHIAKQAK